MRVFLAFALVSALFACLPSQSSAQSGGENMLYGDFKVDESKAGGMVPISFTLVLTTMSGETVERQSVMNDTKYRFIGLKPGFYDLIVESAGAPVARLRVQIASLRRMEYKQDIFLEWDNTSPTHKAPPKKGTVSTADFYQRTPANQSLYDKAAGAIKRKKFDEAAAFLLKVVEADPKDYLAWTDLGTMQYALKNVADAERSYSHALDERPDLLAAAINLARLRVAGQNFAGAIEVLKPTVEKHPESADASYLLGEAYLQTKKPDEAIIQFTKALKLDPQGKAEAHVRMALLYDAAGRKDLAALELEQFLAKRPDYSEREKFERYVKDNKKR